MHSAPLTQQLDSMRCVCVPRVSWLTIKNMTLTNITDLEARYNILVVAYLYL